MSSTAALERTRHRSVGAEYAAIPGLRAHDDLALLALVEVEAGVSRNYLDAAMKAFGTRFEQFHAASI